MTRQRGHAAHLIDARWVLPLFCAGGVPAGACALAAIIGSLALVVALLPSAWAQPMISGPDVGVPGETVTFTGFGFVQAQALTFRLHFPEGGGVDEGIAVADANGNFTLMFRWPNDAPIGVSSFECFDLVTSQRLASAPIALGMRMVIKDLGADLDVSDINKNGQSSATNGPGHAVIVGSIVDLGPGQGLAIDDATRVAGASGNLPIVAIPTITGFTRTTLPLLDGDTSGQATGISVAGVAGISGLLPVRQLAVTWPQTADGGIGAPIALPLLSGDRFSQAFGINRAGVLVGTATAPPALPHGVMWQPDGSGGFTVNGLFPLAGDTFSQAFRVNQAGVAVGRSGLQPFTAVSWASDGMGSFPPTALLGLGGQNSVAVDINGRAQVVGSAQRGDGLSVGALWRTDGTAVIDLNTTLPADADFAITSASALNDAGQIAVTAIKSDGTGHTLLLTPVAGGIPMVSRVSVSDAAFSAAIASTATSVSLADATPSVTVPQGGTVQWENEGTALHTVTDGTGLNLFDSGALVPVRGFAFTFAAAGTYLYQDTLNPTLTGTVVVAVETAPTTGTTVTMFQIYWTSSVPAGLVGDIQIQRPGAAEFVDWQTGQTIRVATFTPDAGGGTYGFRARLRDPNSGAASDWSPSSTIQISELATPTATGAR